MSENTQTERQQKIELIACRALLRRWVEMHARTYMRGGWDYYAPGADLLDESAALLDFDPYAADAVRP